MRWRLGIGGDMVLLNDRGGVLVNVGHGKDKSLCHFIGKILCELRRSVDILIVCNQSRLCCLLMSGQPMANLLTVISIVSPT